MPQLRDVEASKRHTEGMDFESLMTPREPHKVGPRCDRNGSYKGQVELQSCHPALYSGALRRGGGLNFLP